MAAILNALESSYELTLSGISPLLNESVTKYHDRKMKEEESFLVRAGYKFATCISLFTVGNIALIEAAGRPALMMIALFIVSPIQLAFCGYNIADTAFVTMCYGYYYTLYTIPQSVFQIFICPFAANLTIQ